MISSMYIVPITGRTLRRATGSSRRTGPRSTAKAQRPCVAGKETGSRKQTLQRRRRKTPPAWRNGRSLLPSPASKVCFLLPVSLARVLAPQPASQRMLLYNALAPLEYEQYNNIGTAEAAVSGGWKARALKLAAQVYRFKAR